MKMKVISFIALFALVVLVGAADAQVVGNINVNGTTSPNVGSSVGFSGTCGATATGNVTYSLIRNGSGTSVGGSTLGTGGTFNSSITVPADYGSGVTTLVANCPDGSTVSTNLNIMVPASSGISFTGNAQANGNLTLNGSCGTMSAGQSVDLRLVRNGVVTDITNVTTTGSDGNFNGTITIPADYVSGATNLVAVCPNGNTVSTVLNVAANTNTGNNNNNTGNTTTGTLVVHTENPAVGNVIRFSGVCGTTAGGSVQVSIVNSSGSTVIGNVITENGGVFNASLTIPDVMATGNAQLWAMCPGGQVQTAAIALSPDNDTAGTGGSTTTGTGSGTTTTTGTGSVGADVGGTTEGADTTPTGGVAAGFGSTATNTNPWIMTLAVLTLVGAGVYALRTAQVSLR